MSNIVLGVTAYSMAETYLGEREIEGRLSNHMIMAALTLDAEWPRNDEVPWCSAFMNLVCKRLSLPRTKSLRARSWLKVGRPVPLAKAQRGFDVVILSRGPNAPGPEVIQAPGHVGLYDSQTYNHSVELLGGNQDDSVSIKSYPINRVLGVRRLLP